MNASPSFGAALRALPRVATLALAVAALFSDHLLLRGLAGVVLISQLTTSWSAWAFYVRTGSMPVPPAPKEFTEPGPHTVELVEAGRRRVAVVRAVREVTGAALVPAKETVDGVPATLCTGVSAASASGMAARMAKAGASTRITPPLDA